MAYRVKNWERFQQYKDRRPPWIKLYRDLLDDRDWFSLDGESSKRLILIWLIASEYNGFLPDNRKLAFRLRCTIQEIEQTLLNLSGWLDECDSVEEYQSPWPSRYISREVKESVLRRDGAKCVYCSATQNIEIDHIIPVSKGGISEINNLQTLCRVCNRKKRTRIANADKSVASATQINLKRSPETETEAERDTEKEKETEEEKEKKGFLIPGDLKQNESEIKDWLEYKKQRGQTYKPKGLEALWRAFRAIPAGRRRESVDHSMANNWSGLFQKNGGSNGQQRNIENRSDKTKYDAITETVKV